MLCLESVQVLWQQSADGAVIHGDIFFPEAQG